MNVVLAALISAVVTILLALGGWVGARALRRAQVGKTDAETRQTNALTAKTEAESWSMLNGGLVARVVALEEESGDLRTENGTLRAENDSLRAETREIRERLAAAEQRAVRAEEDARSCRTDLDALMRQQSTKETP